MEVLVTLLVYSDRQALLCQNEDKIAPKARQRIDLSNGRRKKSQSSLRSGSQHC